MSYLRTAILMQTLDKVRRELAEAMKNQMNAYTRADELRAAGAEQERLTDAQAFYVASVRERVVGDAFGRACASLREQERALERELNTAEFLGRISDQQAQAVDETMGVN